MVCIWVHICKQANIKARFFELLLAESICTFIKAALFLCDYVNLSTVLGTLFNRFGRFGSGSLKAVITEPPNNFLLKLHGCCYAARLLANRESCVIVRYKFVVHDYYLDNFNFSRKKLDGALSNFTFTLFEVFFYFVVFVCYHSKNIQDKWG